jgi:hypothetical protein
MDSTHESTLPRSPARLEVGVHGTKIKARRPLA